MTSYCPFHSFVQCAQDVEDVRREVAVMEMLKKHPDVVHLEGTFEDAQVTNGFAVSVTFSLHHVILWLAQHVHLVMELCEGGELFDRIKLRKYYSEEKAAMVLRTVAEVLRHCHSLGIMHRDLKPENILLVSKDSDVDIKVIDYGVAAIVKKGMISSSSRSVLCFPSEAALSFLLLLCREALQGHGRFSFLFGTRGTWRALWSSC